jgi:hypothetical protein
MTHPTPRATVGILCLLAFCSIAVAQETRPADAKAAKVIDALRLDDPAQAAKAKTIVGDWLVKLNAWHAEHDAELKRLWADWSKARAVVPKDEFPGEVIAHQIDQVYASLRPAYQDFIAKLSAELPAEKVEALKDYWSRSPGMKRTYEAYLAAVTDLTEEQKQVILDRLLKAREDAMLTDADKEIVNLYKRHKVKVEQYIGGLQWQKLHKAYAEKGKAKPATQPAGETGKE